MDIILLVEENHDGLLSITDFYALANKTFMKINLAIEFDSFAWELFRQEQRKVLTARFFGDAWLKVGEY